MTGEQILEYFITAQLGEAQKLCHQIEAVMMTRLRLHGDVVRMPGRPRGSRNKAKDEPTANEQKDIDYAVDMANKLSGPGTSQ